MRSDMELTLVGSREAALAVYLMAGDVVTLGGRGLGAQRQTVVATPAA